MTARPSRLPIRPGAIALAWRLAVVGIALGVLLTASVGRNGCLRHGAEAASLAAAPATSIHAVDGGAIDRGHAACPLCASSPIGVGTCPALAGTNALAPEVTTVLPPARASLAAAIAAPLRYAPKTSPPVA